MITLEQVKAAYRFTGLKPASRRFWPFEGRCCAMGALAIAERSVALHDVKSVAQRFGESPSFAEGFDHGFCGIALHSLDISYHRGFAIGQILKEEADRKPQL